MNHTASNFHAHFQFLTAEFRLTHFSATGSAEIAFRQHSGELTTQRLKKVWTEFTELTEL
jgi:hypothetical protein